MSIQVVARETKPTFVEAISEFSLEVAIELAPKKSGNICGFYRISKGFQEMRVEGLQGFLTFEDKIGGIFSMPNAAVVTHLLLGNHRTI